MGDAVKCAGAEGAPRMVGSSWRTCGPSVQFACVTQLVEWVFYEDQVGSSSLSARIVLTQPVAQLAEQRSVYRLTYVRSVPGCLMTNTTNIVKLEIIDPETNVAYPSIDADPQKL